MVEFALPKNSKITKGKTWNQPALAGRYLLVRNNRQAACYELPVE